MSHQAYDLIRPETRTTSVVFASPHSGRDYPARFLLETVLDEREIRSSEDAFVDDLFAVAPDCGAPFLRACAPRSYLDLNRAPEELDPALIAGVRRVSPNARVASGLGVIPRVVAGGQPIYRGKISLEEAHGRILNVWRPYHDTLQTLLDESHRAFGSAILIDCHSMPHEALVNARTADGKRPDIVLGDRFGAAASPRIVGRIESLFAEAGLTVARNMPFAGAYIVQHYGRPSRRQHAVQIEVDRSLYMDEHTLERTADFDGFRNLLSGIVAQIADIGRTDRTALAAE